MRGVAAQRIVRTIRKLRNKADEAIAPKPGWDGAFRATCFVARLANSACYWHRLASRISSRKASVATTRGLFRGSLSAARLRRFGGRRGVRTRVRSEGGSRRGRGRFRRTRRAALHDVLDLIAVERFQLEQRLGHRFHLVVIVFDQLARERLLLIDNPPDFEIDLLHW